jgi:hypothetical protein
MMQRAIAFAVLTLLLGITPEPLIAQCLECKLPPPYTEYQGLNTFYNAAAGCAISADRKGCTPVGTCAGDAGDPCTLRCPLEKWACGGKPLAEDWKLVRVTVHVAPLQTAAGIPNTRGSI